MNLTLPKGMDFLLSVRKQGFCPARPVWVFVDENRPLIRNYADLPLDFEVCIRSSETVESLDFRGLIGLSVAVTAKQMTDRLRAILKAIRRAEPAFIGGGVPSENLIFAWHPVRGWEFDTVESA